MTKRAAEQGSELSGDLLAFARRQTLEPEAIGMAALREAVTDLMAHTLGGLVEIEWRLTEALPHVFADPAQLELALMNLIINARDAMPAGGTVTVSAENGMCGRRTRAGPRRRSICPDQRRGHRDAASLPEHLEQVLEPFFTTKEVGKGSGLGLPMVYGFAKQSNGAFRIESSRDKGQSPSFGCRAPKPRRSGSDESACRSRGALDR